ncbi:MAG: PD40 domain-containing protein, partial [Myxococcales bacterium]|nr:PD40 domain-containing protein [Myxococcales bacterium]
LCLCALVSLCGPRRAQAQSADLRWKTLETEHFYVHYYAGEEAAAERMAATVERAYARLSVELGHEPLLKTHVVVNDQTDEANGSASVTPFGRISANVVAPYTGSVLMAYDDWVDVLMTHELVHVLHLDTIHGLPRIVNAIVGFGVLGQVWSPNSVQPRWFTEGIASKYESSFGSQGRYRSSQFDMMLRMPVVEQRVQTLDQVSNGANVFPYGTSPYLYGLHFVHYIGERYGRDKLREFSHVYGGQAIPESINRGAQRVYGVTFEQLWAEFILELTNRFQAQARRIRDRGIREGRRLTFSTSNSSNHGFTRAPMWSQDDAYLYFYEDDGHWRPGFRRIRSTGGRIREGVNYGRQGADVDVERVLDTQDFSLGDFTPRGELVFHASRSHDFRYSWNDLYLWTPPNPDHVRRLTFGLRALDPDVSPDGRTVVFARGDTAQTRLAFLDLDTLDVTEVAPMDRLAQVTGPVFSPDGRKVAFSGWRDGGYRDLYVYDRERGETERITADRYLDLQPSWTPDGAYILFSSDRDDVFNVYAYDVAARELKQVTNVLGGAFDPVVSHDGARMAYVGYSSYGYDLWVMEFKPEAFFEPLPGVSALPLKSEPVSNTRAGAPPMTLGNGPYRPIKTMFPRLIVPAGLDATGDGNGFSLGVTTSISDYLGFHSLSGRFAYLFDQQAPEGSVSYSFRQLLPDFSISYGRDVNLKTGDFNRYNYDHIAGDVEGEQGYLQSGYRQQIDRVAASVAVPVLRHPIHRVDAALSYRYTHYRNLDADLEPIDPNAPSSTLPYTGGIGEVELNVGYTNAVGVRYGYGNKTGRAASIGVRFIDPALGGDASDLVVEAGYNEFLPMPWRGHQVLALRLEGAASSRGVLGGGYFALGGYSRDQDIVRTLIARNAFVEGHSLRGFRTAAFDGDYRALLNLEYRIPIVDVERGIGSAPLFLRRVALAPFTDVGGAWIGAFRPDVLHVGVGGNLIFQFFVAYGESVNLFFTYAHGFDDEQGIDFFQMMLARSF